MKIYQFGYPNEQSSGLIFVQAYSLDEAEDVLDHYATINFLEEAIKASFMGEVTKEFAEQAIAEGQDDTMFFAVRRGDLKDGSWPFFNDLL